MDGIAFEDLATGHQAGLGEMITEAYILVPGAIGSDINPVYLDPVVIAAALFKIRIARARLSAGLISVVIRTRCQGSIHLSQARMFRRPAHICDIIAIPLHAEECPAAPRVISTGEATVLTHIAA